MLKKVGLSHVLVGLRQRLMDRMPGVRAILYRKPIQREIQRQLRMLHRHSGSFECSWNNAWPSRDYFLRSGLHNVSLPEFAFTFDPSKRGLEWRVRCQYGEIRVDALPLWGLLDFYGYLLTLEPKSGDVIIDIGAFNGLTAVLFGLLVGNQGWVLAYEPEEHNALRARRTISASKLSNVELFEIGVDAHSGKRAMSGSGSGAMLILETGSSVERVTVKSFGQVVKLAARRFPDHRVKVKLDVEGAEVRMIPSFVESICSDHCVRITTASYHKINGVPTAEVIERHCSQLPWLSCRTVYPLHQVTLLQGTD